MEYPSWIERSWNEIPRKEDVLFRTDSEFSQANARIHAAGDPGYAYARGYRIGARELALQVLKTEWEQDFLVFPIAFLYRHHIELTLKRLIVLGSFLADQMLTDVEKKHLQMHRLDLLWNVFRRLLVAVYDLPKKDLDGIESYVAQLNAVDPQSQSFRYSISTKDVPSLSKLRHINIIVFAEAMERLCNYFEGIDAHFDVLNDHKAEMLAYKAEFEAELGSQNRYEE